MKPDVIKLSRYDRQQPIEKPSRKWVGYGENNAFPQYLHDLYMESATHSALTYAIAQEYSNVVVPPDIVEGHENICLDIKKQGGAYLEVNYSVLGNVARVRHMPFECVRLDEEMTTAYYSRDWTKPTGKNKPTEYPIFSKDLDPKEEPVQILPVFFYVPGNDVYPKPDYIGSLDWIEAEKSIAKFHVENIRSGFSPLYAIAHHTGEPTPQEREQNRAYYENNMTGVDGSRVIITYDGGKEEGVEFKSFEITDEDKKYEVLSEQCTEKIMIGHGVVNPQMFGVLVPGKLGGGNEIQNADQIFQERRVKPVADKLAEVYSIFGTTTTLSTEVVDLTEDMERAILEQVDGIAEEFGEEWEYFEETIDNPLEEGAYHSKESLSSVAVKLFDASYRNPQDSSEWGDAGLFKLRYAYSTNINDDSRAFCKKMVELSNKGYVYRYEDIIAMGDNGVNSSFSPKGASTYNIFLYKGGVNCHHHWVRRIYYRKRDKGKILPRSKTPEMENDIRVGNNPYVPRKGAEAVAPINTPSKGHKLSKLAKWLFLQKNS